MKSAALAVAFGSEANIGCGSDSGPCPVASVRANAGRSLPAPAAITVANPSRTKSLRLMQPSSRLLEGLHRLGHDLGERLARGKIVGIDDGGQSILGGSLVNIRLESSEHMTIAR